MTVASLAGKTNSFYVDGIVNGEPRSLLLDTGATMTILSQSAATARGELRPTSWSLKTATGERAKVYGETVATFLI